MTSLNKFSVIGRDMQKAQNQTFIHVRNAALSSYIASTSPPATFRFMTKIRFAMKDDAQFLPEIERSSGEVFRQIPHLEWIADDDVQSVERHEDFIRQGLAWVAESQTGNIVGFLNAERLGHSLHIWQMAVHSDHQKQGTGRKLVEAAKDWVVGENLAPITLTTFRNLAWNELFYRKCGFHLIHNDVPASLQNILDAEVAAGLPRDERCAMIYEDQ